MKKTGLFRIVFALLLCMLSFGAAEEEALYPIRENGKWGYMNRQGETVIPPRWEYADPFDGGVAVVTLKRVSPWDEETSLINRKGEILLPDLPGIDICRARDGVYAVITDGGMMGFYDAASGFFQEPAYQTVDPGRLVLAERADGLYGFVRPDSGEEAIPFVFDGLYDEVGESEGYVLAAYEKHYGSETDDDAWGPDYHLMDLTGREILFPEGISPESGVHEGVLSVGQPVPDDQRADMDSGWGVKYGLGAPDGTVLHAPEFDWVHEARDGCVCFWDHGLCGHMDLQGRVAAPARYRVETGGEIPSYYFANGYAVIDDRREEGRRYVILDRQGNEVFSRPWQEGEAYFCLSSDVSRDGLVWYACYPAEPHVQNAAQTRSTRYGLLSVRDGEARYLTGPIFEDFVDDSFFGDTDFFSCGLCAVKYDGLWGYIDTAGAWVLPARWEQAEPFWNGLALVTKDQALQYITPDGAVVWRENGEGADLSGPMN